MHRSFLPLPPGAWRHPLQCGVEAMATRLAAVGDGLDEDFSRPVGEPALVAPDSVSWQVFKNPLALLIGGVAAVVFELAEPRVRAGVHDHSAFRDDPLARLRRTGRATMVAVYGPRSRAEAMIARVNRMHAAVVGTTPSGQPYRASAADLLTWVHASASHCFLTARHRYVAPIGAADSDRYYAEGLASAALFGATGAPASTGAMDGLLASMRPSLEASPLVHDFLRTMCALPLLPRPLAPLQLAIVRAAVQLLPGWLQERLGLAAAWRLPAWQDAVLRRLARRLETLPIRTGAPAQACRRLGLPEDFLYRGRTVGNR